MNCFKPNYNNPFAKGFRIWVRDDGILDSEYEIEIHFNLIPKPSRPSGGKDPTFHYTFESGYETRFAFDLG